jgi:hypothetical protein
MMRRVLSLIFLVTCGWCLVAYPQTPSNPPANEPSEKQEPPVLSVPPGYTYERSGRRDPFVNPVPKPATPAPVVVVRPRPPGLKGVMVSEAAIAGVVTSKEPSMNVVVIKAPGNKTYFARVGDALFDGVVKDIRLASVTFVVTATGDGIQQSPREVVRQVRPAPGENR